MNKRYLIFGLDTENPTFIIATDDLYAFRCNIVDNPATFLIVDTETPEESFVSHRIYETKVNTLEG